MSLCLWLKCCSCQCILTSSKSWPFQYKQLKSLFAILSIRLRVALGGLWGGILLVLERRLAGRLVCLNIWRAGDFLRLADGPKRSGTSSSSSLSGFGNFSIFIPNGNLMNGLLTDPLKGNPVSNNSRTWFEAEWSAEENIFGHLQTICCLIESSSWVGVMTELGRLGCGRPTAYSQVFRLNCYHSWLTQS